MHPPSYLARWIGADLHKVMLFFLGECFRNCLGNENEKVVWDVPNFSGCTSLEFKDVHEKVNGVDAFVIFDNKTRLSYFYFIYKTRGQSETAYLRQQVIRGVFMGRRAIRLTRLSHKTYTYMNKMFDCTRAMHLYLENKLLHVLWSMHDHSIL